MEGSLGLMNQSNKLQDWIAERRRERETLAVMKGGSLMSEAQQVQFLIKLRALMRNFGVESIETSDYDGSIGMFDGYGEKVFEFSKLTTDPQTTELGPN